MNDDEHVTRLFSASVVSVLRSDEIEKLSLGMFDSSISDNVNSHSQKSDAIRNLPIQAGYTYLFQFIAHDIVPDSHPKVGDRKVSPLLNLDSLYGTGIAGFNDALFDEAGKFKHVNSHSFDVWREACLDCEDKFTGHIPEPRNDENIIIVQLHRLWQRLHDAIIKDLQNSQTDRTKLIQTAQQYTQTLFHIIVINDALTRIIPEEIHDYFFKDFKHFFYQANTPLEAIPVEFSHAAFRFGHSMVRDFYKLKKISDNKFIELGLNKIIRRGKSTKLNDSEEIDWDLFFSKASQEARTIDVFVTGAMNNIPSKINIVTANLLSGQAKKLASGEKVLNDIIEIPTFWEFYNNFKSRVTNRKLRTDSAQSDIQAIQEILKSTVAEQRTPLWLFVLHEGLIDHGNLTHRKLGLISSAIVADVLRQSIFSMYLTETSDYCDANHKLFQLFEDTKKTLGCDLGDMEKMIAFIKQKEKTNGTFRN